MNRKILLGEEDIPDKWYNIVPDLPSPLPPPINPQTQQPIKPEDFEVIFTKDIISQEVSQERWISIPEEVREIYTQWRPTPMYRALGLEKALKTPAKIFYKYEGVSPAGSHKPNTAVAQAYYAKKSGVERLATETGAGQWGSALAFSCNLMGMKSTVYMVRSSYNQKEFRKTLMQMWNADVHSSPSDRTNFGRKMLEEDPDTSGSLGIAISEAIEDAATHNDTKYAIGSVLNHVLLHQTVIGQEAIKQFELAEDYPDFIAGCVGGGSSFSGIMWPFYQQKISGKAPKDVEFLAVEPTACPSLTQGPYMFDHGDTARLTPLFKMYTLGHDYVPPPIHAGGLRYHGDAPTLCLLVKEGKVETKAYDQLDIFNAAALFTKTEGILPAPEPAHAINAVIEEALRCKETGEDKTLLFLLCGHGYFDMKGYEEYLEGKLQPSSYPKEDMERSISKLRALYPWLDGLAY